jgi:hypothetical protein
MKKFKTLQTASAVALFIGAMAATNGARADQVFNDDVIITGSLCVGFDCTNGMAFGSDTIVLQENQLRIFFNDTSTISGFPNNDWRLIANDASSGGANYFAIEDATAARQVFRVSAGARSNSIFVSSSGNVGFGTSTPVLVMHGRNSNTPGLRLEQDGSGGFSPYIWDVAGNEANFFVRDVTGGSRLPFRIRPGAPTSSIDIAANGNIGIGTASPALATGSSNRVVAISGSTNPILAITNTSANRQYGWYVDATGNFLIFDATATANRLGVSPAGNFGIGTSVPSAQLHTTGTVRFAGLANCGSGIQTDGSGNLSCITSSRRFKNIAGPLSYEVALANVMALRPQIGAYKRTPSVREHWLIAENVAAIDPALAGFADGKPYTVKTQNVVADLVAVVQYQQRQIDDLKQTLAQKSKH